MHYVIRKEALGWRIETREGCYIGSHKTKAGAKAIAGLLAGWRGSVTVLDKPVKWFRVGALRVGGSRRA